MNKMILGAFTNRDEADRAIMELHDAGFDKHDISVVTKEDKGDLSELEGGDAGSNTAESAASGATTGGILGGLAGLLAGAGVFPALAGLFIGGPIAAALGLTGVAAATASGAVTGALAGGLIGALTGLGVSEDVAKSYDKIVESGGVLIGVPAKDGSEARDIMKSHNATDVTEVDVKERD